VLKLAKLVSTHSLALAFWSALSSSLPRLVEAMAAFKALSASSCSTFRMSAPADTAAAAASRAAS
jgi:hypothetical protein